MTTHLEVSLGPVQGFVAEARRTRDLWGGSFLLSLLSGHAMHAAETSGATIATPVLSNDALYQWIQNPVQEPPKVGSIPNHFIADVDDADHAKRVATAASEAIVSVWNNLADGVWDRFLAPVAPPPATKQIWDRQIPGFWDLRWVVFDGDRFGTLNRRKLWQTRWLPDEPGDKCTVMHGYQELSGYARASGEATLQDEFWADVRKKTGLYDLRDGERLSAIAFTKRLFARLDVSELGWKPPEVVHWLSTSHLGGQPWLEAVAARAPQMTDRLAEAIMETDDDASTGRIVEIPGVPRDVGRDLRRLDPRLWGRRREDASETVVAAHAAIDEELGSDDPGVSQFYALLLADGDRLGRLIREGLAPQVSGALAAFTSEVPNVVEGHRGVTVYAGGDDVLAMLPVPRALACARDLSLAYRKAFAVEGVPDATLSATVVFAHARLKLMDVLAAAHDLLSEVAKDSNGRDSLAVGVLKPGGTQAIWASTWEVGGKSVTDEIQELVALMTRGDEKRTLSESAVHEVRSALSQMLDWRSWTPGMWADPLDTDLSGEDLIVGILKHGDSDSDQSLRKRAELMWSLIQRKTNTEAGVSMRGIGLDPLVVASFLSSGWQENT